MRVPPDFGVITPYIFADDAKRYIDFLCDALGAIEVGRSLRPDGAIANCQLRFGPTMIMLSEASPQFPASRAAYYLYVENADAAMAKAIAHGATSIMDVADMSYDDRQGGIADPAGNIWWLSERLVDTPYTHDLTS